MSSRRETVQDHPVAVDVRKALITALERTATLAAEHKLPQHPEQLLRLAQAYELVCNTMPPCLCH